MKLNTMIIECKNKSDFVSDEQAREAIGGFFARNDCTGKRILLIIPDNTRSGPVGEIFKIIYDFLAGKAKAIHVLVALGTHQPLTEEQICTRLDITREQRRSKYASVKFFNHRWNRPETFTLIGRIRANEIEQITGGLFSEEINVAINKLIFEYDEFFIIGPVFPHEVVGFSGGHKYIFPGIAGSEIINFFHWLSAVITIPVIIGNKWTPPRQVVEKAASFIQMPRKLFAIVSVDNKLNGLFIGDCKEAWEKAADLSKEVHIVYKDKPYHTILGEAPKMYDDIWTAAKVAYKLDPILADGGTLIIYAPHITEISYTYGKILDKIGYHTRDYFLKQLDKFTDIPRAAMAHSTHVKGLGVFTNGVERPRVNVILATGISKERCEKVNLGYMNPADINIVDYENREDEGILLVRHAGEVLHKLSRKLVG
ncbi:MAG: lactate racemase domain-containing protein [Sedimentisphaerales bacterium]|nr:lactate racemase domain-containing protein [Sedimentisphaerales bacterium]